MSRNRRKGSLTPEVIASFQKRLSLAAFFLFLLTMVVLVICFVFASLTFARSDLLAESVLYATGEGAGGTGGSAGRIELDVNGGDAVIDEGELNVLDPGMSEERPFYLENRSSVDVYYRIYFTEIEGPLADMVRVEILLGGKTLYSGILSEMTRENTAAADDILHLRERREFTVRFMISPEADNSYQGASATFRLTAEITQVRNNPDKLF